MTKTSPGYTSEQQLTLWVEQYQGLLLHLCYVILRDRELAKDAVQETFLKAYCASFRGACSEKTWLIQIALNTCRSIRRSAWFRHHDRSITAEDLPAAADVCFKEDVELMLDILRLPAKLREIVTLYYWQDFTVCEIAQILGVSQSTVSRRLRRAHNALRCIWDEKCQEE